MGILFPGDELTFASQLAPVEIDRERGVRLNEGRWHFLMVGTLQDDGPLLLQLQNLLEHPGLLAGNLSPIVFIDGHDPSANLRHYAEINKIRIPLLTLHDIDSDILADLQIRDHERRFVLLDPTLEVIFHADFMKPKDLRLLINRHFGASERESQSSNTTLAHSSYFLPARVEALPGVEQNFGTRSSLFLVVTSTCISCSLNNRIDQLAIYEDFLQNEARAKNLTPALLFSSTFVREELVAHLEDLEIEIPAYSAGWLKGIEERHSQEPVVDWDMGVVETDALGRVTFISGWDEYIDALNETIAPR